jgi:hypothetical protein
VYLRGLAAGLSLAIACAGCSSGSSEPAPADAPEPSGPTVDLRYTLEPRDEALLSIELPPQEPGGTLVSWSAYFAGVGAVARFDRAVKVECYVVQATGPEFTDRVLYVATDSANSLGNDMSVSGSGLVDTADGDLLTFECELNDNVEPTIPGLEWRTLPEAPIQVTLTPVEHERRDATIAP